MLRLSRNEKSKALAQRALRGLAGFAKALKFKYQDIEVGLSRGEQSRTDSVVSKAGHFCVTRG